MIALLSETTTARVPAEPMELGEGEVHVWHAGLDVEAGRRGVLASALDPGEVTRAARFRSDRHRDRFVAGHGIVREILGRYLGVPAGSLRFGYSRKGKPFLLPRSPVQFNLSHAAARLVVAVALDRQLGVDLEAYPSLETVDAVSSLVLSEGELAALRRFGRSQQPAVFTRLWTRKEAYIKADGRGLTGRLHRVDVETLPHRVRLLDEASGEWMEEPRWTLRALDVEPSFAGCVAVEGEGWDLVSRAWTSGLETPT